MANVTECDVLAHPDDAYMILSNYNVTAGSYVVVGCRKFGHRVVGPANVTCLPTGAWSDAVKPECNWTWELTTHEKLVLGTSIAAGAFLLLVTIAIIIAYCCCYRRMRERENENFGAVYEERVTPSKKHNYDHYGPPIIEGGPGIYPDAYYAYQEYPENKTYPPDMTDVSGLDRPWLGYIPRPKVADGRYYH
ncbi:uncharacterized protein [Haliotis cracherodii]|uniref:uncharacterized protein n=1 Tax=Haliotis cracherodii TaxID=6455 RepID=UPI0039E7523B